jgi:hypothetical protein
MSGWTYVISAYVGAGLLYGSYLAVLLVARRRLRRKEAR